ncbi:unnamed protein product [Protopolystoma xenopodis]|uniref:Uncharacterized protein n=1 Tax=Protopolystoma xenopodis TaxID=117903 RepID=A0A448WL12_9PLAT|nr:unnamed protein product [Protopolystoma xenopodis]
MLVPDKYTEILSFDYLFPIFSSGGIGVLMNIDRLSKQLHRELGRPVQVSGLVDSAWYLNVPAFRRADCTNVFECPPEEGIHRGIK